MLLLPAVLRLDGDHVTPHVLRDIARLVRYLLDDVLKGLAQHRPNEWRY